MLIACVDVTDEIMLRLMEFAEKKSNTFLISKRTRMTAYKITEHHVIQQAINRFDDNKCFLFVVDDVIHTKKFRRSLMFSFHCSIWKLCPLSNCISIQPSSYDSTNYGDWQLHSCFLERLDLVFYSIWFSLIDIAVCWKRDHSVDGVPIL